MQFVALILLSELFLLFLARCYELTFLAWLDSRAYKFLGRDLWHSSGASLIKFCFGSVVQFFKNFIVTGRLFSGVWLFFLDHFSRWQSCLPAHFGYVRWCKTLFLEQEVGIISLGVHSWGKCILGTYKWLVHPFYKVVWSLERSVGVWSCRLGRQELVLKVLLVHLVFLRFDPFSRLVVRVILSQLVRNNLSLPRSSHYFSFANLRS